MKITRYWTKGHAEALSDSGQVLSVTAWGWSALSPQEAEQKAHEAACRAARRIEAGEPLPHWYGYSDRPPREEVVREIQDADGRLVAAITRNSYGTLVLNTSDLMFIDVDVEPESEASRLFRRFKSLFGVEADSPEALAQKRIASLASQHSEYTLRLYRTFAGFRCAIINRRIGAGSQESTRLLEEFAADPLYVKLCRNQQSYRARLTPKYWRCGAQRPPKRFPWDTQAEEQRYRAWEQHYAEQCRPYAACRFIQQFGTQEESSESRMLSDLHDELSGAHTSLKLA